MKKLTVNAIALGNLKHRKKQYVLLIIGVVLAMIFSSGAAFFITSYYASVEELKDRGYGKQDAIVYGESEDTICSMARDGKLPDCGRSEEIGYIFNDKAENKGSYIAKFDDKAKELYDITLIEGRLPEKKGEIALEKDAYTRLKLTAAIGEKFTVKLKATDGDTLCKNAVEKTYTLTGITADKRKNFETSYGGMNYYLPSAIVSAEESIEPGGREFFGFYFNFPSTVRGIMAQERYYTKLHDSYYSGNTDLYRYRFAILTAELGIHFVPGYGDISNSQSLIMTLAVVMCIASCIGIINAFNSILNQRKTQVGLYRAVGATKKQIIRIFGRETFLISLLCVPLATLISYFGVKLLIGKIENFVFVPKISALVLSAAVSIVCIAAASLIPLLKAAKTSPMLAVKNTDYNRKMKTKRIKTVHSFKPAKLLSQRSRKFSMGRTVAVSLILAVSILVSTFGTTIIITEKPFLLNYDYEVDYFPLYPTDKFIYTKDSVYFDDSTLTEMYDIPHIAEVRTYTSSIPVNWLLEKPDELQSLYIIDYTERFCTDSEAYSVLNAENYLSEISKYDSYDSYHEEDMKTAAQKYGYNENTLSCELQVLYDDEIEGMAECIESGEINISKLNSGEEILLFAPKEATLCCASNKIKNDGDVPMSFIYIGKESGTPRVRYPRSYYNVTDIVSAKNELKAGETANLSLLTAELTDDMKGIDGYKVVNLFDLAVEKKSSVKIGAVLCPDINTDYDYRGYTFITTRQGYDALFKEKLNPTIAKVHLDTECTDPIDASVTAALENIISGFNGHLESTYAYNRDFEKTRTTSLTALISVLVLFFIIAVSIVNNSFTARIRAGKRQIGTLRAVGASASEIVGMYIREFAGMLLFGIVGGFALYNGLYFITYAIYTADGQIFDLPYTITPAIIFCLGVIIACTLNLVVQVKRLMKLSIVDNIREL